MPFGAKRGVVHLSAFSTNEPVQKSRTHVRRKRSPEIRKAGDLTPVFVEHQGKTDRIPSPMDITVISRKSIGLGNPLSEENLNIAVSIAGPVLNDMKSLSQISRRVIRRRQNITLTWKTRDGLSGHRVFCPGDRDGLRIG
jgi:hypothetical protein